jgi:alginate O-acetyltransferase complex protein AlgI
MFGISFPENFRRPYSAGTVTDFWRRWHISLSSWFRDYVYIPLGGNRSGTRRTYLNLLAVFVLTGFWHGANWTFLAWGLTHGAALVAERRLIRGKSPRGFTSRLTLRIWTLSVVTFGWLLFRSADLGQVVEMLSSLSAKNGLLPSPLVDASLTTQRIVWTSIGLLSMFGVSSTSVGERLTSSGPHPVLRATSIAAGTLAAIYVMSSSFSPFLYFQF